MTKLKGEQEEVAATLQQLRDQNAVLQAQVLLQAVGAHGAAAFPSDAVFLSATLLQGVFLATSDS